MLVHQTQLQPNLSRLASKPVLSINYWGKFNKNQLLREVLPLPSQDCLRGDNPSISSRPEPTLYSYKDPLFPCLLPSTLVVYIVISSLNI